MSSRLIDFTTTPRPAPPITVVKSRRSLLPNGQSFTATVIVGFVFGTTALSLYDLYLFLKLVAR